MMVHKKTLYSTDGHGRYDLDLGDSLGKISIALTLSLAARARKKLPIM
jgi:hypothetical protein